MLSTTILIILACSHLQDAPGHKLTWHLKDDGYRCILSGSDSCPAIDDLAASARLRAATQEGERPCSLHCQVAGRAYMPWMLPVAQCCCSGLELPCNGSVQGKVHFCMSPCWTNLGPKAHFSAIEFHRK